MKRIFPFIFLLVMACKEKSVPVPEEVIQKDKMKTILIDIHVADAVAETKAQAGMNEKLLTEEYHQQIFKNHQVTQQLFVESMKFYESNPKLLDEMYAGIQDELSKREAKQTSNDQ